MKTVQPVFFGCTVEKYGSGLKNGCKRSVLYIKILFFFALEHSPSRHSWKTASQNTGFAVTENLFKRMEMFTHRQE
jgi:hypothetical protein